MKLHPFLLAAVPLLLCSQSAVVGAPALPDKTRPLLIVTSPKVNGGVTNSLLAAEGKAKDSSGVAAVYYKLNDADWSPASSTNSWTNWTARLTLTPGANVFKAYAVDKNSNNSLTNTIKFTYLVYAPLTVQVEGKGTATPSYTGKLLQIGKSYPLTARPEAGSAFASWSGSLSTNKASISFVMASNLTFMAHFVDIKKPLCIVLGPKANQKLSEPALLVQGKASDNVGLAAVYYHLNSNNWAVAQTTNHWTNWSVQLSLDYGANVLQAFGMDAAGNCSLTNTVKCSYATNAVPLWAPSSLSGLKALVASKGTSFTLSFSESLFCSIMLPGAKTSHNSVGQYSYSALSANTGFLHIAPTAPPQNADARGINVKMLFTAANKATCSVTNSDGTVDTATVSLSSVATTAPTSLSGRILTASPRSGGSGKLTFGATNFSMVDSGGGSRSGTYSFVRYSPTGGLLILTTPAQGSVDYVVVNCSTATSGNFYLQHYIGSSYQEEDGGSFTLK